MAVELTREQLLIEAFLKQGGTITHCPEHTMADTEALARARAGKKPLPEIPPDPVVESDPILRI